MDWVRPALIAGVGLAAFQQFVGNNTIQSPQLIPGFIPGNPCQSGPISLDSSVALRGNVSIVFVDHRVDAPLGFVPYAGRAFTLSR